MDKVVQDISMCKRAGKLILGFDVVKKSLVEKTGKLIVIASDISPKTLKEVEFLSKKFGVKFVTVPATLDELWYVLGKRVGVMSVIDKSFSDKILTDASPQLKEIN